jgi:hypothetical protein
MLYRERADPRPKGMAVITIPESQKCEALNRIVLSFRRGRGRRRRRRRRKIEEIDR